MPSDACASRISVQRRERDRVVQRRAQRAPGDRSSPRSPARRSPPSARPAARGTRARLASARSSRSRSTPPIVAGTLRLAKYLAHAGVASRRASEAIIADGRVTVDGAVITDPARDVDDSRAVKVDGKRVRTAEPRAGRLRRQQAGGRGVHGEGPAAAADRRLAGAEQRTAVPRRPARLRDDRADPADQRRRPRAPADAPVVRGPAHVPRPDRERADQRAGAAVPARGCRARRRSDRAGEGAASVLQPDRADHPRGPQAPGPAHVRGGRAPGAGAGAGRASGRSGWAGWTPASTAR